MTKNILELPRITNIFRNILVESNRKPCKIWLYNESKFQDRSIKSWLQDNDIETYSPVVAQRFIRTLKNTIHKYMTSVSKIVYINNLADIVNKQDNIFHSITKVKPVDVKSSTYINFGKKIDDKDPKFKVGDHVKI